MELCDGLWRDGVGGVVDFEGGGSLRAVTRVFLFVSWYRSGERYDAFRAACYGGAYDGVVGGGEVAFDYMYAFAVLDVLKECVW